MVLLNIGLHVRGGKLDWGTVLASLHKEGVRIIRCTEKQSASEPTLVVEIDRALTDNEAYWISVALGQDCIAQQTHDGEGQLHGPKADDWGPFNPDYFLTFEEVQS